MALACVWSDGRSADVTRCTCCRADDVITPDTVYEAMEDDMAVADMVLWVGISFEQSASTQYFRNVRRPSPPPPPFRTPPPPFPRLPSKPHVHPTPSLWAWMDIAILLLLHLVFPRSPRWLGSEPDEKCEWRAPFGSAAVANRSASDQASSCSLGPKRLRRHMRPRTVPAAVCVHFRSIPDSRALPQPEVASPASELRAMNERAEEWQGLRPGMVEVTLGKFLPKRMHRESFA